MFLATTDCIVVKGNNKKNGTRSNIKSEKGTTEIQGTQIKNEIQGTK